MTSDATCEPIAHAGITTIDIADIIFNCPVPPRPVQWRRALAALRILADETKDPLDATYTVADALGGMCDERLFQKLRHDPAGRRLLAERRDLPALLDDHARLAALPPGSLGRTYAEVCMNAGIHASGLVDSMRRMSRDYAHLDPARQWFIDRLTVLHDLWHILTGYATKPRGEAAIVAFSLAQGLTYRPIPIFLAMSVFMRIARPADLWAAFWRGRRTAPLVLQRYEELLALPLEEVRRRLRIPERHAVHGPRPADGLLA